jgi:hypothetical protein
MKSGDHKELVREVVFPVLAIAAAGNFFVVAVVETAPRAGLPIFFWAGAVGAQVGLQASWIALWAGKLWVRVLAASAVGIGLFAAFALGLTTLARGMQPPAAFFDFIKTTLLCSPLISLAAQVPLWLVRIGFQWRIIRVNSQSEVPQESPLAIRDIMAATGAVAFVFAAARYGKPSIVSSEVEFFIPVLISGTIAVILSATTTLPLVFAALKAKDVVHGLMFTVAIHALIGVVMGIIGMAVFGFPDGEFLWFLFLSDFGFLGSQFAVLLLVRNQGYRIVSGRLAHLE